MRKCADVEIGKWENGKMWKLENGKMGRRDANE
jgi:hypothetical protein